MNHVVSGGDRPGQKALLGDLRAAFHKEEAAVFMDNCRRGAVVAIAATFGGATMDWVVYPGFAEHFLYVRTAFAFFLAGILALLYWQPAMRFSRVLGHMIVLLPIINVLWMIAALGEDESAYYAGLNLVMVGSVLLLRWKFTDSVINSVLCLSGYLSVEAAIGTSFDVVFRNSFFILVTGIIACVGIYFYNRLRFSEYCLRIEVEANRAELAHNHERLRALDEAKTRFFANISHELRTPLTLILAPVEKLRGSAAVKGDETLMQMVDSLEDNGLRLLRLINDLLDLVKLDTEEMKMRPERFRPAIFLEGLGRNLGPMADRNTVALTWSSNEAAQQEVYLDRDRLEKIVLNLAVNALKFTPPGGRVEMKADVEENTLRLSVADTGEGMTGDQIRSAFERFWQADSSVRRKHQGVGIGLALVKSLTESMDGTVGIESEFGKGTTFSLTIPLVAVPEKESEADEGVEVTRQDAFDELHTRARLQGAAVAPTAREPRELLLRKAGSRARGDRERILIADDEAGLRAFLRSELEELGCEVVEAKDGAEAWELAQRMQPSLAVLDMMMPEMDGITLTRKLRESEGTSQLPIVLVTARADDASRIQALEAGVSDFLTKPFSTAELRVRIVNLLDGQRYQRQLNVKNRELGIALQEIKANEARLLHAEKLSSLGRMSAGIVHEVNNPLNYAKTALHALRIYVDDLPEEEREDYMETVGDAEEGVGRVIRIISDLRSFTKGETAHRFDVSLGTVLESARRLVSHDLQGISYEADLPEGLEVSGNDNQLCQVFVNLMQNSAQAVVAARKRGEEPTIVVKTGKEPDGRVFVSIRDNGCGISAEDVEHLFDPFFTKREVGEGMGLGLSICHRILESHGASIEVTSELDRFTQFTIHFPTEPDDDEEETAESPESSGTEHMEEASRIQ
ncbi:MAG: ATP-binding protein [Verrucomicrobia bacterium]|nr:ATP-binding protein [Verrucomicrobiota bacterium]